MYKEVSYKELALVVRETETFQDLQSESWRLRRADGRSLSPTSGPKAEEGHVPAQTARQSMDSPLPVFVLFLSHIGEDNLLY